MNSEEKKEYTDHPSDKSDVPGNPNWKDIPPQQPKTEPKKD